MWFNIIGFFASIIFYLSIGHNMYAPVISPANPMQDSLVSINAKFKTEIARLQAVEKTLLNDLLTHQDKLHKQEQQVNKQKQNIYLNVHSGWDNLSKNEQDQYTDQLIKKFKKPKR